MARKSSPRSAPLAVCRVCLSDPEQADVPPNALWVAIVTSTPRRFNSTAARKSGGAAADHQGRASPDGQSEAARRA